MLIPVGTLASEPVTECSDGKSKFISEQFTSRYSLETTTSFTFTLVTEITIHAKKFIELCGISSHIKMMGSDCIPF